MSRRTVIITDGEQRAALAIVRSLGEIYRCVVTVSSRRSLAGSSRFCAKTVVVPDPLRRSREFGRAVCDLAASEGAALVLPVTEAALAAILPLKLQLAPAIVPFPDIDHFAALTDKKKLLDEAVRVGIAVPRQQILPNRAAVDTLNFEEIQFPVVLKPSRSLGDTGDGRTKLSVSYASSRDELRRKVGTLPSEAFPILVQQRVIGIGTGVFLLTWAGEVRAVFAHRRLSEKPASGGVSVYCESIRADEDLLRCSRALLDRFSWEGVAMVEYKRDASTGTPYLMEVNGRFWGSLQLAIDAGVDFPRLLAACALGDEAPIQTGGYSVGLRSRWWWGQVDHLVGRVGSRAAAALPPGTRSARRAVADLLLGPFRRQDHESILRWNDPRPFFNETIRWIGEL
ncbi:MAG TPA: ATP-grasp domain-containing protein [Gemmatimonadaceae bacterium]|nr:ATP-grasp domain-containing protein [Gemmatimonadaceae bacterium]